MSFTVQTVEAITNGWRHAPKPMTDINVLSTYGLVKDVLSNLRGTACSYSPNGYLFVGVGLHQHHQTYPNEANTCIIPANPGVLPTGIFISSRDQAFFPRFFAVLGPSQGADAMEKSHVPPKRLRPRSRPPPPREKDKMTSQR